MIVVLLPLLGSRWCESKDDDEFLCVCRDGYQGMFTCNCNCNSDLYQCVLCKWYMKYTRWFNTLGTFLWILFSLLSHSPVTMPWHTTCVVYCVEGYFDYVGALCETLTDYCTTSPCRPGSTCTPILRGFECHCAPGFLGEDCYTEIDYCSSHPCLNGGSCVSADSSFECVCPSLYTGQR